MFTNDIVWSECSGVHTRNCYRPQLPTGTTVFMPPSPSNDAFDLHRVIEEEAYGPRYADARIRSAHGMGARVNEERFSVVAKLRKGQATTN